MIQNKFTLFILIVILQKDPSCDRELGPDQKDKLLKEIMKSTPRHMAAVMMDIPPIEKCVKGIILKKN